MKAKTIIISLAILIASIPANAQLLAGVGAGYSVTNNVPSLQLEMGLALNRTTLLSGFITHISNQSQDGALFYLKAGRVIKLGGTIALHPSAGYGFLMISSDKTELNSGTPVGSLEILKKIGWDGQVMLYAGGYVAKEFSFAQLGVKIGLFTNSRSCR